MISVGGAKLARIQHASLTPLRSVDFSGVQLNFVSASILSDVFTIEWGLRKLLFRECDLDDQASFFCLYTGRLCS